MCYLFLILLLLNEVSGLFWREASTNSILIFYSIIIISFCYWIKLILSEERMPKLLRAWSYMLILFTLYGIPLIITGKEFIIHENFRHIGGQEYLKLIYLSMLPIFPIYDFAHKGQLTPRKLMAFCLLLLVTSTYLFSEYEIRMIILTKLKGLDISEFTNNTGYLFLEIIPLTLIFRKHKIVMTSILLYCMYMIIISMKRGAILLGIPCIIILLYQLYKTSNTKQRILVSLMAIIIIGGAILFIQNMYETSDYFNERLTNTINGDSSHREEFYSQAINIFLTEDLINMLLGNGGYATLDLMQNNAHNDWFEILINNGILGVIFYTYLCIQMYKMLSQTKENSPTLYTSSLLITTIFIGRTFFSMSYSDIGLGLIISLGYIIAQLDLLQEKEDEELSDLIILS